MKTSYLLLLCVLALLYFGMYKQGNWWTYENQDGTKKDSIHFTAQFFDYLGKEPALDDCITWQYRHGNIGSRYLYRKSNIGIDYTAFTYQNPYTGSNNYTRIALSMNVSENFATFKDGVLESDTIILNYTQNSKSYSNVIKNRNHKYFAPNIGLIRWDIGSDTFTLKKYYIR
jgi:hypothetical protein